MPRYAIGQGVTSVESLKLVAGHGRYTDDVAFPGQCHAIFVRSLPCPNADIRSIDYSQEAQANAWRRRGSDGRRLCKRRARQYARQRATKTPRRFCQPIDLHGRLLTRDKVRHISSMRICRHRRHHLLRRKTLRKLSRLISCRSLRQYRLRHFETAASHRCAEAFGPIASITRLSSSREAMPTQTDAASEGRAARRRRSLRDQRGFQPTARAPRGRRRI